MEENNILIAEFLGYEILYKPYSKGFIEISETEVCDVVDLEYHSDWNALMEVVEKIETVSVYDNTFFVEINIERVHIKYYRLEQEFSNIFAFNYANKTKKETVYMAVVEFIKWYNEQKQ